MIPAMDIYPKRGNVLRFSIGGQVLFRKSVHIPAHKLGPRPYLLPALMRMKPEILASYQATFTRVAKEALQ